jgi:nitroreductase
MIKDARNKYPINDLSRSRWSPRAFSTQPVEKEKLQSLMEAARWSASGGNEQPWRFILGIHPDETWVKIFETLEEGNKIWVKSAPVLLLSIGKKTRGKRNTGNFYYAYDTGQSVAHLSIEAVFQGLYVHQMAGFVPDTAIRLFSIPEDYQPLTVVAIGYPGNPDLLPEELQESELAERTRKEFDEFVFSGTFGDKTKLF